MTGSATRELTPDQILGFVELYSGLDRQYVELRIFLESRPDAFGKFEKALFGWGSYYELPFQTQAQIALKYTGVLEALYEAATSKDPAAALLALGTEDLPVDFELPTSHQELLFQFFGFVLSLRNSVRSVGYFGKWLNELLSLAKTSDDVALFQAVSVDPCVLGAPFVQHRIARAQFRDDRAFVERLSKALLGPSKKISTQINKIRLVGKLLVDSGDLPESNVELVDLFCNKLKLYPSTGDPAKALRKLLKVVTPSSTT